MKTLIVSFIVYFFRDVPKNKNQFSYQELFVSYPTMKIQPMKFYSINIVKTNQGIPYLSHYF